MLTDNFFVLWSEVFFKKKQPFMDTLCQFFIDPFNIKRNQCEWGKKHQSHVSEFLSPELYVFHMQTGIISRHFIHLLAQNGIRKTPFLSKEQCLRSQNYHSSNRFIINDHFQFVLVSISFLFLFFLTYTLSIPGHSFMKTENIVKRKKIKKLEVLPLLSI